MPVAQSHDGPVTWDLLRPISVAGLLYRVWAAVMVKRVETLASETVSARSLSLSLSLSLSISLSPFSAQLSTF